MRYKYRRGFRSFRGSLSFHHKANSASASSALLSLVLVFFLLIFLIPVALLQCSRIIPHEAPAYKFDICTEYLKDAFIYSKQVQLDWIEILAYARASGTNLSKYNKNVIPDTIARLSSNRLKYDKKLYTDYYHFYKGALQGIIGSYQYKKKSSTAGNPQKLVETYDTTIGVKAFFPFAAEANYSLQNDYGTSRSYGDIKHHEGNDMMAKMHTPVIAIEPGYIENIGWNNAGGYRLGLRSLDGKRYYYYAHFSLYSDYVNSQAKGDKYVEAGAVIGYVGDTGNSKTPGTRGLMPAHLHIQIGVDTEVDGKEKTIWINPYGLLKFIEKDGLRQDLKNPVIIKSN